MIKFSAIDIVEVFVSIIDLFWAFDLWTDRTEDPDHAE